MKKVLFTNYHIDDKSLIISLDWDGKITVLPLVNQDVNSFEDVIKRFQQLPVAERHLYIQVVIPNLMAKYCAQMLTESPTSNNHNTIDFKMVVDKRALKPFIDSINNGLKADSTLPYIAPIIEATDLQTIIDNIQKLLNDHKDQFNKNQRAWIGALAIFMQDELDACLNAVK
ncbi:hypothetical protein MOO44_08390 [Nicoliella spurrieriana]|uniref:Uncharacterized protein n=1 Tax=Nicoliella spurrieriana TaxID=2925830 RepID=A0A976X5S0_9LACO|nr:hypothetical protein [Nicoliella spurrieriana]UQS86867.1 hypothetical protein MOO44_08390 [Nicoliella spurrieriana]